MDSLISAADVAFGRRLAEAHMIDRCRITKPGTGEPVRNEATLQITPPERVVVYEGKCRVQVRSDINANSVEAVVGDHEWTYRTATLQLPIAAGDGDLGDPALVRTNYVAELLEVPLDPSRVGIRLNLQAESKGKTHSSHRRFRIKELLS